MNCPKCDQSEMKTELVEGIEVRKCSHCHGIYLNEGQLDRLIATDGADSIDSPEFTEMSDRQDMVVGRCHRCNGEMEPCWGPANMRLDRCPTCKAVFLDEGEFEAIRSAQ